MIWGLFILYILSGTELLISANRHGKPRPLLNFWIRLVDISLILVLVWWALEWRFI